MKSNDRPTFRYARSVTESPQSNQSERELLAVKQSSYWGALYQGWFATGLEQTRSIFTLASAGVGLALTLVFGAQVKTLASWAPVWLLLAALAFASSSWLCVCVFRVNGILVTKIIKGQKHEREDAFIGRLDTASRIGFVAGLACLLLSAVAQIWL